MLRRRPVQLPAFGRVDVSARGASELVQSNLVQLLDDDGVEGSCHALGHAARSDGGVDGGNYVDAAVHA